MSLYIQDPANPQSPFLHEKILEKCQGATCGAGAFSFVTHGGVELLLRDTSFKSFAEHHSFTLVVGVDEITNLRALDALQSVSDDLPGLTVKVFYHELPNVLFHPKMCWFKHARKGTLIVGSGNLTAKGMRSNWEAFTVDEIQSSAFSTLKMQWDRWMRFHECHLRSLDDQQVRARAALNVITRRARKLPIEESPQQEAIVPPTEIIGRHRALIAEIPRASNRWNQANFDLNSFSNYFGATPGATQRIVLQHVNEIGDLAQFETRPGVAVRSRNFRFELEAAAGLPYPAVGRPIAVFVEIAPRTFRYRLLMPNDAQYHVVSDYLDRISPRIANRMRREIIEDLTELQAAWPDSPLWQRPMEVTD